MRKLSLVLLSIFFITIGCNKEMQNGDINKSGNGDVKVENGEKIDKKDNNEVIKKPINKVVKRGKEENMKKKNIDYQKLWKGVYDDYGNSLPKSALKKVDEIYETAKENGEYDVVIKALLHKLHYIQDVEEETFVKIQKLLVENSKNIPEPYNQVVHSMIAEQYWNYYQNNRWKFSNRSKTQEFKQEDMRTWSLEKIVEEVNKHYQLSIKNSELLQKTEIAKISKILSRYSETEVLRSTFYDFLAHRAIDFYMNTESGLTKPAYYFTLNNKDYLSEFDKFVDLKIETKDKDSFKYKGLIILQNLSKFYKNSDNLAAKVDLDLKRLKKVYDGSNIPNKKFIYETILHKMIEKYKGTKAVAEVKYELANLYEELAGSYVPKFAEQYKNHYKKAHEICLDTYEKYPKTFGGRNCKYALIPKIEKKSLYLNFEKVLIPGKKERALVSYRNIKKLYVKIIETDIYEFRKHRYSYYKMIDFYKGKKSYKTFEIEPIDDKDYQPHKMEINIPELEAGKYIFLISDGEDFNTSKDAMNYAFLNVSNISYINRKTDNGGALDVYVFDRTTGETLKKAKIQKYYEEYSSLRRRYVLKKGAKYYTDNKGYAKINQSGSRYSDSFWMEISHKKDDLFLENSHYLYKYGDSRKYDVITTFFIDRGIYRPGQTVYFKGITYKKYYEDGEKSKVLPNVSKTITFYDVNYQKIASVDVKTNKYGTFSGTFQIPLGVLNGQMNITDGNHRKYFSVEEYKRPKFEVKFEPVKEMYRVGEKVKVTGKAKAYAGFNIDDAKVKYRVVRDTFYPYRWYYWYYTPPSPQIEILNGFTKTDKEGKFVVEFDAIPDLSIDKSMQPAFHYTVYADVTDINGETRSSSKVVSIGYKTLKIVSSFSSTLVDKNSKKLDYKILTTNLSGEFIPAEGTIEVIKLKSPDRVLKSRRWDQADKRKLSKEEFIKKYPNSLYENEDRFTEWKELKTVYSSKFDTKTEDFNKSVGKKYSIEKIDSFEDGVYKFVFKSKDRYNQPVKEVKFLTFYNSESKELPYKIANWFTTIKGSGEPGEKASFIIGSSYKNVKVLYEVEHKNKIVKSQFIKINNEQKRIDIPIKEKHRGNFSVYFTFIKNNREYIRSHTISVPWSNKNLKVEFLTFRNKLKPGEKDEWKIKISGPDGDKVAAEMVATLYDASLDAFRSNSWGMYIFPHLYASMGWSGYQSFGSVGSNTIGYFGLNGSYSYKYYDSLNWFGFYWRGYRYYHRGIKRRRSKGALKSMKMDDMATGGSIEEAEEDGVALKLEEKKEMAKPQAVASPKKKKVAEKDKDKKNKEVPLESTDAEKSKSGEDLSKVKARTNFNETAFFYPHLETDKDGSIIISFTVPESLTKWKMLGFAHTEDLKSSSVINELVTQKDLMVIPNAPRFFRENDKMVFSAKVKNLTENELKGDIELQFFDALTMEPVDKLFKNDQKRKTFKASDGGSDLVTWDIEIPEGVDAVTYRVVAKSGKFSDGEEMVIPVLKNRMMVTETMPLPVRALQTKTFKFEKLINSKKSDTLRHHKLTLEFTSNPAWYAVQALPYMMEYPYECMEQTFTRYYANSLASYIVNKMPKIKKVFDRWKNDKDSKALLSNLEKNQELKALLLQETPWVLNGKNETERKKRVALLFDLNRMSNELTRALRKLSQGQMSSGGWPWFKGGMESRYITQHIVTGFAHLHRLGVIDVKNNPKIWNMLKKAIPYLDWELKKDYDRLLNYKVDLDRNNLSYIHFHYFYARSYFKNDISLNSSVKTAFDYYFGQEKKYWKSYNKYTQGLIALTMNRYKEQQLAKDILKSIKEHALYSEEMGMYWKEQYGYYWYQAPIETQALLIEAFDEILEDEKSVDDMKTWLLKSKQTQDWKTTKATADACYALLLKGDNWLAENKLAEITLGDIKVDPEKMDDVQVEAGTGYFKTSWSKGEIKPEMGNIVVKNRNKVVAWGGVYWQYFENLDKITSAETPLKLKKKLFVERSTDKGPVLIPIEKEKVQIGDRVKVRIELRVDRDMEYVHMKDMRASTFEPENVISQYKWQDGLGYYESTKDGSTNFFISYLKKGTYVFEYPLRATHKGNFSNGITTIQCMYAPEFSSHSEGVRVDIK